MSDHPNDPNATPPPPPPQQPAPYSPPAGTYQPPPAPGAPVPPPVYPPAQAAGRGGLLPQFTGNAGWGILLGIICIVVPLVFNRVFFFLPIIGLIAAIYAIVRSKQLIGGIIGIVLNVIGGIITILALLPASGS